MVFQNLVFELSLIHGWNRESPCEVKTERIYSKHSDRIILSLRTAQ